MATQDEDWQPWAPEAQAIVASWEAETLGRLLSTKQNSDLVMRIARALRAAYARGLAER